MNASTKMIACALSLSVFLSSCNSLDCIEASGNQISQDRNVGSFTRVETSGSMKIILIQGPVNHVKITADDNILKEIETHVRANKLTIDLERSICDAGAITVYVTAKEFEGVEASGDVEILSEGNLKLNDFELDLSGSSKVVLDLNAANVKTSSSGASEIFLKGQAGSHELVLTGSTSVQALDFVVGKYRIESSGASNSRINVLNELIIRSRGASEVEYRGNPSNIKNDDSGASSLKKID